MSINYNEPFEVNKKQYDKLKSECSGILAHREDNGRYFVKVWLTQYNYLVEEILNTNQ